MENHAALGLFALYVVAVSFWRYLGEAEIPAVTALKRCWGRTTGLLLHFLLNVLLPLVLGVCYLSRGVALWVP